MASLSALSQAAAALWAQRQALVAEMEAIAGIAGDVASAIEGPAADQLRSDIAGWGATLASARTELYWVILGIEAEIDALST